MDVEEFRKQWKKILIEVGKSEAEVWRSLGSSQSAGNQKTRNGTIKYIEFVNVLDGLGYDVEIVKRK